MPDIYLLIEGQRQGPYSEELTRQSLAEGLIPADLPAWHEGLADWVKIGDLLRSSDKHSSPPGLISDRPARITTKGYVWMVGLLLVVVLTTSIHWLREPRLSREQYRTADNTVWITVLSSSEIEYRDSQGALLGRYEIDGNSLRLILYESGNEQSFHFQLLKEGLLDEKGNLFLSPKYFDIAQLEYSAKDEYEKGNYPEAIADYTKVISTFPSRADPYTGRGDVERRIGDVDAASKDYEEALRLDPKSDASDHLQELSVEQQRKLQDSWDNLVEKTGTPSLKTSAIEPYSIDSLSATEELQPNDPKIHNALGCACSEADWQEVAEKELRRAIELDPNYTDAHYNLAIVYILEKPPCRKLAQQEYQKALNLGAQKNAQLDELLYSKL